MTEPISAISDAVLYLRSLTVTKTWPTHEIVVKLDFVDFQDADERTVSVFVYPSSRRTPSAMFPHGQWESGRSLGSDELDEHARRRAVEEVVRYLALRDAA